MTKITADMFEIKADGCPHTSNHACKTNNCWLRRDLTVSCYCAVHNIPDPLSGTIHSHEHCSYIAGSKKFMCKCLCHQKKCKCDIATLLAKGCKCGGA